MQSTSPPTHPPKLVVATHNQGKLREFRAMMADLPITIVSISDFNAPEPQETATTFAGNAALKAQAAFEATGLPALADDSGLCVDALDGAPGIYSARWAGEDRDFRGAMARITCKVGPRPKDAHFVCTLAFACAKDMAPAIFEGRVFGHICWPPRGGGGHGYDSFFVPTDQQCSFAELSQNEKNKISPRAHALEKFTHFLSKRLA